MLKLKKSLLANGRVSKDGWVSNGHYLVRRYLISGASASACVSPEAMALYLGHKPGRFSVEEFTLKGFEQIIEDGAKAATAARSLDTALSFREKPMRVDLWRRQDDGKIGAFCENYTPMLRLGKYVTQPKIEGPAYAYDSADQLIAVVMPICPTAALESVLRAISTSDLAEAA